MFLFEYIFFPFFPSNASISKPDWISFELDPKFL